MCVCATQPGALCGGCSSRGRAGSGGWERREPARAARAVPSASASSCVCVRSPGWRRARLGAKRDASSQRNRKFCGRGALPADEKNAQLVFQSQARRSRGTCVSLGGPEPLVRARLPHASRAPGQKKEKKGGRPKGTDSRGGAPDARPKTHALQNDTPPPEPAPAGMLQGLPIAAERRAVGWGNGEGAGEGVATSTTCFVLRGRSRAARSGLCQPPPGYFSTFPG